MYQVSSNNTTGGVYQIPPNQMPSPGANAPTAMPAPAEHISVGSENMPVMMVAPSYNQPPQVRNFEKMCYLVSLPHLQLRFPFQLHLKLLLQMEKYLKKFLLQEWFRQMFRIAHLQ